MGYQEPIRESSAIAYQSYDETEIKDKYSSDEAKRIAEQEEAKLSQEKEVVPRKGRNRQPVDRLGAIAESVYETYRRFTSWKTRSR